MKIQLFMVFILVWCHFIADFLLQSEKMALNKSKSFKWLNIHAIVYGAFMILIGMLTIGLDAAAAHSPTPAATAAAHQPPAEQAAAQQQQRQRVSGCCTM